MVLEHFFNFVLVQFVLRKVGDQVSIAWKLHIKIISHSTEGIGKKIDENLFKLPWAIKRQFGFGSF